MGSPMTLSHLTLSDIEKSKSRSLMFRSLVSRKVAELGPMLLLNWDSVANTRSVTPTALCHNRS